jgi:hypothetical protein
MSCAAKNCRKAAPRVSIAEELLSRFRSFRIGLFDAYHEMSVKIRSTDKTTQRKL